MCLVGTDVLVAQAGGVKAMCVLLLPCLSGDQEERSCNTKRGLSSRVSSPKTMGGMLLLLCHEPIYLKWGETNMSVVTSLHFSPPKHELNHAECSPLMTPGAQTAQQRY